MKAVYAKRKPILPLLLASLVISGCASWLYQRTQLERQAGHGKAASQFQLAKCFYDGTGMTRNYGQAASWFRKAAEQGHVQAQTALGMMYLEGQGVPQNYDAAAGFLRKAADQGSASAQNQLGMLYAKGHGVSQDLEEAGKWFGRAAARGNASARHNLLLINAARVSELERLTVRNGSTFEGIKVQKVERDCLTISYHPRRGGVGVVRVGFKDLPEQLQEKYGFDTLNKGASAGPDQLEAIVLAAL